MGNVPLKNEDIENTITSLPRHPDDAHIFELKFKKMLAMKSSYAHSFIRNRKPIEAIKKLKALKNPHYVDVELNEDYLKTDENVSDDEQEILSDENNSDEESDD